MKFIKHLSVLFITLLLCSCTALGIKRSVSTEDQAKIKNIAVYSGFTEEMNHTFIGITIFGNEEKTLSVPEFGIRDFSENIALSELKKSKPNANIKIVRKANNPKKQVEYLDDITEVFKLSREAGADTLIWIRPTLYDNAPLMQGGYGLFKRVNLFSDGGCPYSLFSTYVFDTTQERELAWEWGFTDDTPLKCDIIWKENPKDYTANELENIKILIKSEISKGIKTSLQKLKL